MTKRMKLFRAIFRLLQASIIAAKIIILITAVYTPTIIISSIAPNTIIIIIPITYTIIICITIIILIIAYKTPVI
jgi:hypothetical protein